MTPSFTCPACGLTTFHEIHMRMQHCVRCHKFIPDWAMYLSASMSEAERSKAQEGGYIFVRNLPGGCLAVEWVACNFANLKICRDADSDTALDVYEYDHPCRAIVAAAHWRPDRLEPLGWSGHPRSRRRRPGGDVMQEYLAE